MKEIEHEAQGYEHDDVRIRPLAIFLVALGALVAASLWVTAAISGGLTRARAAEARPRPMDPFVATPEGPLLETDTGALLVEQRAWEDRILSEYAWVDRAGGTVRIPIERALELVVERGLPVRPAEEPAPAPPEEPAEGSEEQR